MSLSNGGDQIFAFQGTLAAPTFITGISMNVVGGNIWEATLGQCPTFPGASTLPAALNATNSMGINPEVDNAIYNCIVTAESPANLRTAIFNSANWTGNDATAFTLPIACTFSCSSCTSPTVPTVSATSPICAGGSSTLTITGTLNSATAWHIYSGSCGGTLVGTTAGSTFVVSPGATTTYFVRGEGGCVIPGSCGSTTVTVNTAPATPGAISGTTTICSGTTNTYSVTAVPGATSYTWTLPGGWTGTSTTNSITTTASATSGNVSVTANNLCGASGSSSQAITVNTSPATPGAISGTTIVCSGSSNTYSVTAVPGATSYTWTLPGGWTGTSTTNSITTIAGATGGNISVTASNTCGTSGSSSQAITVPSAIVLTIASQTNETCGLLNAALSVNPATGGSGGYVYDWTPGTPTGDGTTSITGIGVGIWTCMVTDATSCTATVNTTITNTGSLDNASFNYSAASYCTTDVDQTPTITGLPGGSFSSTAGLSINASTGVIDVSASIPATYTVTYLTAGPCPNSTMVSVTILGLDNAGFNYSAASYCTNAVDPTPTVSGLTGGTFSSSPAGLSINASTGVIDVSASTPVTYTVTYTTSGPCPNSSNVSVTINATDNAGFNYSAASYCSNAADPTPTITGLSGGTFSSTAGLSINASTGVIDVSASTPGTYTVTYTTTGSCPNSSNVSVTINALDNAGFNYSAASYCTNLADPTPTITGLAGGTFSSTAGLSINASTGVIDVSASTPGTYTVTYTTSGPCPNSSNISVTINALNTITLSSAMGSDAQSLLINTAINNITYSTIGATGATFSGLPMGVIGVWAGDVVTISGSPSEEGIFNYTVTLTGGCGTVNAMGSITVIAGIAQIMGGTIYSNLQGAIDAATPGQTIMLLGNVSEPNVNVSNSVTINANGFTLTIPSGNLTIPIGNSLIWPSNNLIVALGANIINNGTLCNNGIIDYNNPSAWTNTGLYKGTGTFNGSFTNNGTFSPGN